MDRYVAGFVLFHVRFALSDVPFERVERKFAFECRHVLNKQIGDLLDLLKRIRIIGFKVDDVQASRSAWV